MFLDPSDHANFWIQSPMKWWVYWYLQGSGVFVVEWKFRWNKNWSRSLSGYWNRKFKFLVIFLSQLGFDEVGRFLKQSCQDHVMMNTGRKITGSVQSRIRWWSCQPTNCSALRKSLPFYFEEDDVTRNLETNGRYPNLVACNLGNDGIELVDFSWT